MNIIIPYILLAISLTIAFLLFIKNKNLQKKATELELNFRSSQAFADGLEDEIEQHNSQTSLLESRQRSIIRLAKNKYVQLGDWERAIILISEITANTLNISRVSIWNYDKVLQQIVCIELYEREKDKHQKGLILPASEYPIYFEAIESEEVIIANDAYTSKYTQEFKPSYLPNNDVAAMLDVPYFVDTKLSGVVCCENKTKMQWAPQDIQFVQSIAYVIAIAYKSLRRKQAEDEILIQKTEIEEKNVQLAQRNEEIMAQRDLLEDQNKEIERVNEELQSLNENLEKLVQERTTSLIKANKQLEIAYQELDLFTYRASHDFRGPITTLLGLTQIGQMESKDELINTLFEKIKITTRKMDNMLTKLLMVHDINYKPTSFTEININDLLEDVQNALLVFIRENHVQLHLSLDSEPYLFSDYELMNVILLNLTENAIFFRSDNKSPEILVKLKNFPQYTELTISDNGVGIPPEVKDRIFDMFFRGSTMSNGSGLGLYVVKKALEKLNGTISIQSEPNKLTTFNIQIPKITQDN